MDWVNDTISNLDVDWMSLALPVAYITVLGGSLYTFSTVYRKRKAYESANIEPWFPTHLQRNVYMSLRYGESEGDQEKVPKSIIRAALMRRAMEDIRRIVQIRTSKQALNTLLQRGSVGEDLNQRFLAAEKDVEEELRDVVAEANELSPGWGQTIFQSANEIYTNHILRARLTEISDRVEAEKEWWAKRKEAIKEDFMKELEDESAAKANN